MRRCSDTQHLYICNLTSSCSWYVSSQLNGQASCKHSRREITLWRVQSGTSDTKQLISKESSSELTPIARPNTLSWRVEAKSSGSNELCAEASKDRQSGSRGGGLPNATSSELPTQHSSVQLIELDRALLSRDSRAASQAFLDLQKLYPGHLPEADACSQLVQLLSRERNFQRSWRIYQAVKSARLRYTALAMLMDTAIGAQEPLRALEVFRDMQERGYRPNKTTWAHLISGLLRTRRKGWPYAETAYSLWQELLTQEEVVADMDASSYAVGMMACTSVGRLLEARELLDRMQTLGFRPDVRVYNILIKGLSKVQATDAIPELMKRIKDAGLEPSARTYNTLVDAYANAGLPQQARQMLEEAKGKGLQLDVWAYSSLIKGYVRTEQLTEALAVLDEIESAGLHPNVVTLTTLLDGCVRLGEMQQAESILRSMEQKRIPANVITYNALLRGYAMAGDLKTVRDVLQRMGESGVHPREDTFNTLMEGALHNNDPELVPQLFKQLVNLDLRPDSLSYTALITALARLSQPDSAVQAFGKLEKENGLCAIALNALIAALANSDRMVEAEEQLQRATALAADEGQPPPIEAYGVMIKAYARLKDANAALDLFSEFRQNGGEPDDKLVDMVATACVRAGQFKQALQLVRAMERAGKNIDRARIKQTLETVMKLREEAHRRRPELLPQRNENLERFKFWLGLPNSYYGSDADG